LQQLELFQEWVTGSQKVSLYGPFRLLRLAGGPLKLFLLEWDYYPWGSELQLANSDSNHYKFTGKERDAETGLDYFGARYYGNSLGRFITPDWSLTPVPVPYADLTDPQSLNQYSCVRNIPTSKTDPDGHCCLEEEITEEIAEVAVKHFPKVIAAFEKSFEATGTALTTATETAAEVSVKGGVKLLGVLAIVLTPTPAGDCHDDFSCKGEKNDPNKKSGTQPTPAPQASEEHTKDARPSTREDHQQGQARKRRDRGGEKGDARRRPPRKRPPGWKGPWPPDPNPPDPRKHPKEATQPLPE